MLTIFSDCNEAATDTMSETDPLPDETLRLQTLNALKVVDTRQEERFDRITKLAQRLLDVPIAMINLVDEDRFWLQSDSTVELPEMSRTSALCEHALMSETVFLVEDATKDERFCDIPVVADTPGVRFYLGCPVSTADGLRRGTLCVLDTEPRQIGAEDIDSIQDLGHLIEDELATLTMATTDELTKLANRRGFLMIAEPMIALCQRAWHPTAAAVFDLDGLKEINDEFGHEAGDLAITDFAKLLLKVFRDSDVVARIGGDEFCVLLTDPDEANTSAPLERLQQRVASYNADSDRPFRLTFSAGSVPFDKTRHDTVDDLLRDADERMYVQKRSKKCAREVV